MCDLAPGYYSLENSSTNTSGNENITINSNSGSGESGVITFQKSALSGIESTIQNMVDADYKLPDVPTSGGVAEIPAETTSYVIIFTDGIHMGDVGVDTVMTIYPDTMMYTLQYFNGSIGAVTPLTAVGADLTPSLSNTAVTWIGNVFTLTVYSDIFQTNVVRQISYDYTAPLTSPVAWDNRFNLAIEPGNFTQFQNTEANGGFNLIFNDVTGTPFVDEVTKTFQGSHTVTDSDPNYTLDVLLGAAAGTFTTGTDLLGYITIYINHKVVESEILPTDDYMFYDPPATQVPAPSITELKTFLEDGTTDTALISFISNIVDALFYSYQRSAKEIFETVASENTCSTTCTGRFSSCVNDCKFGSNVIIF